MTRPDRCAYCFERYRINWSYTHQMWLCADCRHWLTYRYLMSLPKSRP